MILCDRKESRVLREPIQTVAAEDFERDDANPALLPPLLVSGKHQKNQVFVECVWVLRAESIATPR
jgi:hypothetical protein